MKLLDVVSRIRVLRGRHLSLIILLVVLAALTWYGVSHRNEFARLATVRPLETASLPVLWIFLFVVSGLMRKTLLRHLGVDLSTKEWFGLGVAKNLMNLFTPFKGGAAVEAVYLKRRYGFSISLFATFLVASEVIFLTVAAILGLVVSAGLHLSYHAADIRIVAFFAIAFGLGLIFLILPPSVRPQHRNRFLSAISRALSGWRSVRSNGPLVFRVAMLGVASIAIHATRTYLAYRAISIHVDFLPILLLAIIVQFTTLVKITPGNLGIIEGAIAATSSILGIGFEEGLAAAGIIRVSSLLMLLTLGPAFSYSLGREMEHDNDPSRGTEPVRPAPPHEK